MRAIEADARRRHFAPKQAPALRLRLAEYKCARATVFASNKPDNR